MGSSFLGLSISGSGLAANQLALNVTSHNIANANTEGYTRQRLTMYSEKPQAFPGIGSLGLGVSFDEVEQIRDDYLDFSYRNEAGKHGEWEARAEVLNTIETIFNEPSDAGIREVMDQYFTAVQELNKTPESLSTRTLVRQRAIALAEAMNGMSETMKDLQRDLNFELQVAATELNGYAQQVAELNELIYQMELTGGIANDIRDQRNLLVDKMSELADIDYYEDSENRFHVLLDGNAIVAHYRYDQLEVAPRTDKVNSDDAANLVDIRWASGNAFSAATGRIKGIMDARDNINGETKGVPYYLDKLNSFISTLTDEINQIHAEGYGLNDETGYFMFTINDMTTAEYINYLETEGLDDGPGLDVSSQVLTGVLSTNTDAENDEIIRSNITTLLNNNSQYEGKDVRYVKGKYLLVDKMTAGQVTLAADMEDLNKFAASKNQGDPGDGSNILEIANVRHDVSLYDWGSADDFVKSLVSNLGVDTQEAERVRDNQYLLVQQVETNRQSISGVSLDEEMSNMVKFQHAYNANARMINVIDEMLDLVVNRLGTVGR